MVAVHNDYRLEEKFYTFWLFTHPSGRYVKGEGKTDHEAVSLALAEARIPTPTTNFFPVSR